MVKLLNALLSGVVVGLGLGGVACQPTPSPNLTMITAPNYCPYEFTQQDGDSTIVGFDIDLAQAIARVRHNGTFVARK